MELWAQLLLVQVLAALDRVGLNDSAQTLRASSDGVHLDCRPLALEPADVHKRPEVGLVVGQFNFKLADDLPIDNYLHYPLARAVLDRQIEILPFEDHLPACLGLFSLSSDRLHCNTPAQTHQNTNHPLLHLTSLSKLLRSDLGTLTELPLSFRAKPRNLLKQLASPPRGEAVPYLEVRFC